MRLGIQKRKTRSFRDHLGLASLEKKNKTIFVIRSEYLNPNCFIDARHTNVALEAVDFLISKGHEHTVLRLYIFVSCLQLLFFRYSSSKSISI